MEYRSKVVTILENDSALQTLLGGTASDKRIYSAVPDKQESFPCIVLEEVDSSLRTVPSQVYDVTLQISFYTKGSNIDLEALRDRVDALLNYYKESGTIPRIVYIIRTSSSDENDRGRRLFAKIARYQIWFKEN